MRHPGSNPIVELRRLHRCLKFCAHVAFDDRHRTLDLKVLLKRLAEPQSVAERVLDHDGWAAGEGWVNARAELGMWA